MAYRRKTARHRRDIAPSPNQTRATRMVLCPCCGRHARLERFEARPAQVRVLHVGGYKGIEWDAPRAPNAAEVKQLRAVLREALANL